MNYTEILEKLTLSDSLNENSSFLEKAYNYKSNYEKLNLAIIKAAKIGDNEISFDFIDSDLNNIENKTYKEVESKYRKIYPSYGVCYALQNTFNYPKYLAARGFNIEIRKALKNHGYKSKSYYITWK